MTGVTVALDDHQNGIDPSANFAGIGDGSANSPAVDAIKWANYAGPGRLAAHAARHTVDIAVSGQLVAVSIDGGTAFKGTMGHIRFDGTARVHRRHRQRYRPADRPQRDHHHPGRHHADGHPAGADRVRAGSATAPRCSRATT